MNFHIGSVDIGCVAKEGEPHVFNVKVEESLRTRSQRQQFERSDSQTYLVDGAIEFVPLIRRSLASLMQMV